MVKERHGLSIGIERTESTIFLSLKLQGKLTHQDYQTFTSDDRLGAVGGQIAES